MTSACIGFRAHSGWAACVVIAGPPKAPYPIDRRRIELISKGTPRQPYHAAERLALDEAAQVVNYSIQDARRLALAGLRAIQEKLAKEGFSIVGAGLLMGSGRPTNDLASVLASHALIHTAEGELFREALAFACRECGVALRRVREKELLAVASSELSVSEERLQARLAEMRAELGPPWTQDQKLAALAAWLSLPVLP